MRREKVTCQIKFVVVIGAFGNLSVYSSGVTPLSNRSAVFALSPLAFFQVSLGPLNHMSIDLQSSNAKQNCIIPLHILSDPPSFSWKPRISLKSTAHIHRSENKAANLLNNSHVCLLCDLTECP